MSQEGFPPASSARLSVCWDEDRIGEIWQDEGDGQLCFAYHAEWIRHGQAISFSMPLQPEVYRKAAQNYFANLLPEGDFRRRIERIFQVSTDNDYSLLATIGGDCAGALSIRRADGGLSEETEGSYEAIPETQLTQLLHTAGASAYNAGAATRLSLAGAQGKLPVYWDGHRLFLPRGQAASTHIVKFNRHDATFPALIENEYLLNRIAFHLSLPVVEAELRYLLPERPELHPVLITRRYDRVVKGDWPERLHQEDFCQVLGLSYQQKYQKEGGPSVDQIIHVVRQHLKLPDVAMIVQWQLFNWLFGNSDGHGKNLSLLYTSDAGLQLAPLYDLVCTRAYQQLDASLSMSIGGEFDPESVRAADLQQMAKDCGVTRRYLDQRLAILLQRAEQAIAKAFEDFSETQNQRLLGHNSSAPTQLQHVQVFFKKWLPRVRRYVA